MISSQSLLVTLSCRLSWRLPPRALLCPPALWLPLSLTHFTQTCWLIQCCCHLSSVLYVVLLSGTLLTRSWLLPVELCFSTSFSVSPSLAKSCTAWIVFFTPFIIGQTYLSVPWCGCLEECVTEWGAGPQTPALCMWLLGRVSVWWSLINEIKIAVSFGQICSSECGFL